MKKVRILPLHVEGTIASSESKSGFKPKLSFTDLLNQIDKDLAGNYFIAQALSPFGEYGIDSAGMQLSDFDTDSDRSEEKAFTEAVGKDSGSS